MVPVKVTKWLRYDREAQKYVHNHIECGHVEGSVPAPSNAMQRKEWENTYWMKAFCYMVNGEVIIKEQFPDRI